MDSIVGLLGLEALHKFLLALVAEANDERLIRKCSAGAGSKGQEKGGGGAIEPRNNVKITPAAIKP